MRIIRISFSVAISTILALVNIDAQINIPQDTLKSFSLEEVFITASKSNRPLLNIPGKVEIISKKQIENLPAQKVDDLLRFISGVNVNRPTGNYTMRPSVTLRNFGGDEQGRTLVLINNMPMNTSDEGGVNWNRINLINIQKIEVFKGSGSSLYGNNAMGGVINIITRKPVKPFEALFSASYGSFNTYKPEFFLGGNYRNKLNWSFTGFYQRSDGYINVPTSKPEYIYSVARYLKEGGISANLGYNIGEALNIDFQLDLYRDKRGEGEKIMATDGEYRNFNTNSASLKFSGRKNKFEYQLNFFIQREKYYRLDERMKGQIYSRFDVKSDRDDQGAFLNSTYNFNQKHNLTLGVELKNGRVKGGDYYQTTDDMVLNQGTLTSSAIYLQDEWTFFSEKLNLTSGLRIDHARFHDGNYNAVGNNVNYWMTYTPNLKNHSWNAVSPRAAMRYQFLKSASIYISYSRGFRASILDDLCRSGWMWIGPKIANPNLGPEYLNNYEAGMRLVPFKNWTIEPCIFYSFGNDFLYYVATGDSLSNRPIYRRENISQVGVYGTEIDLKWNLNPNLNVWGNYSYNFSQILKFNTFEELEGKSLKYSPNNKASLSFIWLNKWLNTSLAILYKGQQYSNDDNTTHINGYVTMDMQLSHSFIHQSTNISLGIQDLMNNQHLETEDYLSPGRILTLKLQYKL